MNRDSAFGQTCSCGRTFTHDGAFKNHQNTCKKSKKRLSLALKKAKELFAKKQNASTSNTIESPEPSVVGTAGTDSDARVGMPEIMLNVEVWCISALEGIF